MCMIVNREHTCVQCMAEWCLFEAHAYNTCTGKVSAAIHLCHQVYVTLKVCTGELVQPYTYKTTRKTHGIYYRIAYLLSVGIMYTD